MQKVSSLAAFVLLVFACAALGSWFTFQEVNGWYLTINKPAWTPPAWLFGPVWTVLYLTIAVSVWLIWHSKHPSRKRALVIWSVQLALNVFWSACFFAWKSPALALIEITILWLSILTTILVFWRIKRLAAGILAPYLAWVSFAAALNLAIWRVN